VPSSRRPSRADGPAARSQRDVRRPERRASGGQDAARPGRGPHPGRHLGQDGDDSRSRDDSFRVRRTSDEARLDVPDNVAADQLDREAMAELRTLPGDLAEFVARLLVATAVTPDPDQAYRYAKQARNLAARVGVVRETCAIAAYQAGDWATALTEFRAARRLTGRDSYLPLMADCERAMGRLDRALELVTGPEARAADGETRIELRIVESGIRRDQGLLDAAVVALNGPELSGERIKPEHARLYYAYADALLHAGREDEARDWFGRASAADVDGETDADERVEALDDIGFDDLDYDPGDDQGQVQHP
jgi:tetratricopeptide (TPR) repeat protein